MIENLAPMQAAAVDLTGIPETMLWTLHNRAAEARKPNGMLRDPDCVRIYDAIAYDYRRSFGRPDQSHPMRSRLFDDVVRPWLDAHPGGTVVELAAGLETQYQRCDDGRVQWLCIDVPEAIEVRSRFLPPTERCRYVDRSALDLSWLDEVDPTNGVFVTAQGLLMYFEEAEVRRLFQAVVDRFPGVELMFDTIPVWFSKKTLTGFGKTRSYRAPPMPWGIARDDIEARMRDWSPRVTSVAVQPYGFTLGLPFRYAQWFMSLPGIRNHAPTIAHVKTVPAGTPA